MRDLVSDASSVNDVSTPAATGRSDAGPIARGSLTRRWLALATVVAVIALFLAGCGVVGGATGTAASTRVVAAESLLANRYAGSWWSDLFGGGKNEAPLVGSVQAIIGADYTNATSGSQKSAALDRLSTARSTVAMLRTDHVLSQADATKVLVAVTQIESVINKP